MKRLPDVEPPFVMTVAVTAQASSTIVVASFISLGIHDVFVRQNIARNAMHIMPVLLIESTTTMSVSTNAAKSKIR